ncbi:MAG: acyl phosphate:glycerol-3-phosphate acyltransferase [Phycisphaerales bacterium]|jgi:glycerol-3-phosphate acyltransferase PlsY|nr:acyl phosphate:glycerol-3-phosphate acyltransferase [Phycisphaerales bacterium]
MSPQISLLILIPLAYLVGSIPFGLIVGLARGVDPRKGGSGNIGATNVARLLGKKFFFLVFTLDMCKSLVPMLIASAIAHRIPEAQRDWRIYLLWLLVGFAAVLGHMFSVFLRFKGGKGVATSAGVMLGLWPYFTGPGLVAIVVFIVVFYARRFISLGSIAGASAFPIAYLIIGLARGWPVFASQLPLLIFAVVMAALIVYKHRSNIVRLRAGTEPRFGAKPVGG